MNGEKGSGWRRWGVFNLVGLFGFAVQLSTLFLLKRFAGFAYMVATAIAVEIAVLHNFIWHEHVTWSDVVRPLRHGVVQRLIRFHIANGIISILGNLAITWALVECLHVPYLAANGVSVLICSLLNFVAADRFVFRRILPAELRGQVGADLRRDSASSSLGSLNPSETEKAACGEVVSQATTVPRSVSCKSLIIKVMDR